MGQAKRNQRPGDGKFARIVQNNFLMLKYIFSYVPFLIVFETVIMIVSALTNVISNVYGPKFVLDSVQQGRSLQSVAAFLAFMLLVNIINIFINAIFEQQYFPAKKAILFQKMHAELFQKAKEIELACYDNPKFYNDFVWATSQADEKALDVLNTFGKFVQNLTSILAVGTLLVSMDFMGIVVAIISVTVSFLINLKLNTLGYKQQVVQKPVERKRDYTRRVLYLPDYAKEIRLSQVKGKLTQNFSEANGEMIKIIRTYGKKMLGWDFIDECLVGTILINGVYVIYLLYKTMILNAFGYGSFVALLSGAMNLSSSLGGVTQVLASFQNHSMYIDRFRAFLEYEPKLREAPDALSMPADPCRLQLKNVAFWYDTKEHVVLDNINIDIQPGEKIALVGYNGAGKTTLVKLIMRLYDVTEGEILLGGQNIKQYNLKQLRDYFGVVFQDYQLFAATLGENVLMAPKAENQEDIVVQALQKSGFESKLKQLEQGTETILTREFSQNGVNLSGGEAQKVAISRIFPRNCKVVIMDEPSSALDPISEYNVNQAMLKAAEDKTVIFISHRLSATRVADRVIMLENGRVIEEGTHDALMEKNGKYAEMFRVQAKRYQDQNQIRE